MCQLVAVILLHSYSCHGYSTLCGHDTILGLHVKDIPQRNSYCYEICLVVAACVLGSDLSTMLICDFTFAQQLIIPLGHHGS